MVHPHTLLDLFRHLVRVHDGIDLFERFDQGTLG